MKDVVTKATMIPARKHQIRLMLEINYGRIESLEVHDGEAVFDSPPSVPGLLLFGKCDGPNASRRNDGFALKKEGGEAVRGL